MTAYAHCAKQRASSEDHWERPQDVVLSGEMQLTIGDSQTGRGLNDWSFTQLCRMAGVSKDTINRLSYSTASRALQETLPRADKPLQIRTKGSQARSVHGVAVEC